MQWRDELTEKVILLLVLFIDVIQCVKPGLMDRYRSVSAREPSNSYGLVHTSDITT